MRNFFLRFRLSAACDLAAGFLLLRLSDELSEALLLRLSDELSETLLLCLSELSGTLLLRLSELSAALLLRLSMSSGPAGRVARDADLVLDAEDDPAARLAEDPAEAPADVLPELCL